MVKARGTERHIYFLRFREVKRRILLILRKDGADRKAKAQEGDKVQQLW